MDVAAGRKKADLVLKNATYVNVFSNELCHGDIAVARGQIAAAGDQQHLGAAEAADQAAGLLLRSVAEGEEGGGVEGEVVLVRDFLSVRF